MALGGPDLWWTPERHMLATGVDALRTLNWQMGSGKRKDRPDPIPRPGIAPRSEQLGNTGGRTPQQVKALLAKLRPRPKED